MIHEPPGWLTRLTSWLKIALVFAAAASIVIWFLFWIQGQPSPVPILDDPNGRNNNVPGNHP